MATTMAEGQRAQSEQEERLDDSQMPSIKITKRVDRSFLMMLMHTVMRPFKGKLVHAPKEFMPAGSPQLELPKKASRKIESRERQVEGIYVYDLSAKESAPPASVRQEKRLKRIYYFAGGGWQSPPSSEHWALFAELVPKLPDTAFTLVSYPLAPNSPAPHAFPQLMNFYRKVMEDAQLSGEDVILVGDSAGGNIVLCLVVNALLEDQENNVERPCPAAILAMCPSTDMRRANPDMREVVKRDPLLNIPFVNHTAQVWCGDWDPTDTRVSPLYADVTPLAKRGVKVHGITGRYDILSCDALLFREKCNQAWVSGEWLDWDKQMHCWPLAFSFKLRESIEAKDWILDLLKRS